MGVFKQDVAEIEGSPLFDSAWYLQRYPDAGRLGLGAAEHYVRLGAGLVRDPGPSFSASLYLEANPDVAASGENPLLHYLRKGRAAGLACFAVPEVSAGHTRDTDEQWTLREDMHAIQASGLFDADYYLRANPDVKKRGMDPLFHFARHGAKEGRQPNPWFATRRYRAVYQGTGDTENPLLHYLRHPYARGATTSAHFDGTFYLARYADTASLTKTPLQHYLEHGVEEGRQTTFATQAHAPVARIVDGRRVKTTVIVPIFNACAEARACIQSIRRHTRLGQANHLLLIDDASTDPAVRELFVELTGIPGIRTVQNPVNVGYTRTINKGCELAGTDDVLLLNSDTIVGPHWLRNLKIAAYRTDRTGTVTAVSNNAGAFSVPEPGTNALPEGVDVEDVSRLIAGCRFDTPFEVPTGNGFCFYIKRALLDDVGLFDEDNFPVGYGEENEFCMRALEAGWCHRVDPATYVGHVRSASFGDRKQELADAGLQRVRQIHPEYAGAVRSIVTSDSFNIVRDRIARRLKQWSQAQGKPRPRIMYVISTRVGGTPQTNADLMHAMAGSWDCYALWCDRHKIEVLRARGTDYEVLQSYPLTEPLRFATHVSGEYDDIVRSILTIWGIELLHIRHLAWHSLNLVDVADSLEIPVIHSFHDFYTVCPSVTLVGADGSYQPNGVTHHPRNPLWPRDPTDTDQGPEGLLHWQQRMQKVLSGCSAFVTTSQSAVNILTAALPILARRMADIHVIPHGRDFERFEQLAATEDPAVDEPLRILLPGNIGLQKGLELIKQVKQLDTGNQLEFHLLGKGGEGLAAHVIDHGPYSRGEFGERVARIRPHIAVTLSIGPETYCHTLTECWSCGIPVLGIDLGAVGERIGTHGGGWLLVPPVDAVTLHAELSRIRTATEERQGKIDSVIQWQASEGRSNTTARMADWYTQLYRQMVEQVRPGH
jgi:GT2 family glycosyltransferase